VTTLFVLKFIGIFFLQAITNVCFALWARRTASGREWQAGGLAGVINIMNGTAIVLYVSDPTFLVPVVLGSIFGTVVAIKWDKQKQKAINDFLDKNNFK